MALKHKMEKTGDFTCKARAEFLRLLRLRE